MASRRAFLALAGAAGMSALLADASGKRLVGSADGALRLPTLTRYAGNPVIATGAGGSWNDSDCANPDVKWDARLGQWVMQFSGYDGATWHTGIAYSTDLLTWTAEAANPVLSPSGVAEGNQATNGSIVQSGSTYYLYYQGQDSQIRLATSTNLTTWTRYNSGTPVVAKGSAGQWDAGGVYDPFARLLADGTVELHYAGGNVGLTQVGIGRATSSDLSTFTKTGRIFAATDPTFSTVDFGEPSVVGAGSKRTIQMDTSAGSIARRISQAYTTDNGATWTWAQDVLANGSGWDSYQVFDNCPVVHNGTLYLFYAGAPATGYQGMGSQIGVATAPWPSGLLSA